MNYLYQGREKHSLSVLNTNQLVACGGSKTKKDCISWQPGQSEWTHFRNLRCWISKWTLLIKVGQDLFSCPSSSFPIFVIHSLTHSPIHDYQFRAIDAAMRVHLVRYLQLPYTGKLEVIWDQIRLWRVPATRPDPNFYFATRNRPDPNLTKILVGKASRTFSLS